MSMQLFRLFILSSFVLFTLGCNSEDPNPELRDPIYKDLKAEYGKHKKMLEDAEKALVTVEAELEKVEVRSLDRKIKGREYQKAMKEIVELKEMTEYYRIKSELRRVYGRKAYRVAFHKKEEWPNPKEFDDYNTNKRLRAAPRNWSHRVPKSKHQQLSEESTE